MSGTSRAGVVAGAARGRTGDRGGLRRLVVLGATGTLAAVAATTVAAALARAGGVDFEVSGSAEPIPVSGIAVVTGFFSAVGVVIAAALLRWSARPAERFVATSVSLTAISLVPPLLYGEDAATVVALVGLHLVAAGVMIPVLSRGLRREEGAAHADRGR